MRYFIILSIILAFDFVVIALKVKYAGVGKKMEGPDSSSIHGNGEMPNAAPVGNLSGADTKLSWP